MVVISYVAVVECIGVAAVDVVDGVVAIVVVVDAVVVVASAS